MTTLTQLCTALSALSPFELQQKFGVYSDKESRVKLGEKTIDFRFFNERARYVSFEFDFSNNSLLIKDDGKPVDDVKTIEDAEALLRSAAEAQ